MLKNDARNDASFNKRENWTKIEKIVNFIYYPNKIDPFVKNGFFSENVFVDERCIWSFQNTISIFHFIFCVFEVIETSGSEISV